jgi:CRP/FNR family cyclic AMP-dependent transcriptional regulator
MKPAISIKRIEEFLSTFWVSEPLDPPHLRLLAKLVKIRHLKTEQILWLQGQRVTHFSIVFYGKLRSVRCSSTGGEKLVSSLPVGHHFGLAEMITKATSSVTIIATEPTILLILDRKTLKNVLLNNADISYRLMKTMARAIFSLTRELERASFENVHTRLARLLLRNTSRGPNFLGSTLPIQKTSHAELALQIGVSRETVSRVLADFKRQGLINTAYRSIAVCDREGLMHYVEDFDQW